MKSLPIHSTLMLVALVLTESCARSNFQARLSDHRESTKSFYARIAVWDADANLEIREVAVESLSAEVLTNNEVDVPVPGGIQANTDGCFCYEVDDPRFAYVNAFRYATEQLKFYGAIFEAGGKARVPRLTIKLQQQRGIAPSGDAGDKEINFAFDSPRIDPSVLAHEVGHEIHFHARGMGSLDWQIDYKSDDRHVSMQQAGVNEGVANLLGALFMKNSRIGFASYVDVPTDIDTRVVFPSAVPTFRYGLEHRIQSRALCQLYPKTVEVLEAALKDPKAQKMMDEPDPYLASAVINQPIWQLRDKIGVEAVATLAIRSINNFPAYTTYASFAERVLLSTPDDDARHFLQAAYRERGLLP